MRLPNELMLLIFEFVGMQSFLGVIGLLSVDKQTRQFLFLRIKEKYDVKMAEYGISQQGAFFENFMLSLLFYDDSKPECLVFRHIRKCLMFSRSPQQMSQVYYAILSERNHFRLLLRTEEGLKMRLALCRRMWRDLHCKNFYFMCKFLCTSWRLHLHDKNTIEEVARDFFANLPVFLGFKKEHRFLFLTNFRFLYSLVSGSSVLELILQARLLLLLCMNVYSNILDAFLVLFPVVRVIFMYQQVLGSELNVYYLVTVCWTIIVCMNFDFSWGFFLTIDVTLADFLGHFLCV